MTDQGHAGSETPSRAMNAYVQACSAPRNQMLRLAVPDPESWRGLDRIYRL
jgi:hypothetical protein